MSAFNLPSYILAPLCQTTCAERTEAMAQSMTGVEALIKTLLKYIHMRGVLTFDANSCQKCWMIDSTNAVIFITRLPSN